MVTRILLLFLVAAPAFAAEVAGVKIDEQTRVGSAELVLKLAEAV